MTVLLFLQIGLIIGGLTFLFMLVSLWLKKKDSEKDTNIWAVGLIGGFANFCDTLGVGSFAIKTAGYKQFNLIDDKVLPGTLNAQATMATVFQALIFLTAVNVDLTTLISLIIAACVGATVGARLVSNFDRQLIRLIMAGALLVVALLMFAGRLDLFPLGGEALGLTGEKLVIGIIGNFIFADTNPNMAGFAIEPFLMLLAAWADYFIHKFPLYFLLSRSSMGRKLILSNQNMSL